MASNACAQFFPRHRSISVLLMPIAILCSRPYSRGFANLLSVCALPINRRDVRYAANGLIGREL
jgi:hypothetical protein